ncbi:MAG: GNAT family N-acetyltransferase [Syntrophorhabdales bacterium]
MITEEPTKTWYIRPIRAEDTEAFLPFLSAWVTNVSLKDRYRWMYQDNPHGKALTWLAVTSQDSKIVGCASVFPRKMWLNGHVETGSAGGDTYVDPLWRRKGIAEALHRASSKGMRENGVMLQYGFPLRENLKAKCKAGACLPGDFVSARCFLSIRPFVKKVKLDRLLPGKLLDLLDRVFLKVTNREISSSDESHYVVREVDTFDERFEAFSEELSSSFKICCVRDSSYLRWRFLNNPFRKYVLLEVTRKRDGRLYGFAAVEVSGDIGLMSEFFVRPESDAVKALLLGAMRFAVSRSLRSLWFELINPTGPFVRDLARSGFKLNYSDQKTLDVMGDYKRDALTDLRNWHLTLSDLDV